MDGFWPEQDAKKKRLFVFSHGPEFRRAPPNGRSASFVCADTDTLFAF
jgi:hypothetical protein